MWFISLLFAVADAERSFLFGSEWCSSHVFLKQYALFQPYVISLCSFCPRYICIIQRWAEINYLQKMGHKRNTHISLNVSLMLFCKCKKFLWGRSTWAQLTAWRTHINLLIPLSLTDAHKAYSSSSVFMLHESC